MPKSQNRKKLLISAGLSLANLALIGGMALAAINMPAQAQGTNTGTVERPSGGTACPSGWRTVSENTKLCEPQGSLAPKIYAKKEKETCASGYYEVHRLWCSTRKP
ncbi:MAG: hypothetical protein A2792_06925 [Sphingomonadales bacterium RIFCSPHIGHO2_01_FULL_65_20]|jgi:hypothetical protein|uniref:Uncharacterized protein n=1 Tax=Sphingomonas ursincola TaxID=56361 RepID=A0A7V8RGG2_9SPHN|nr:hypothetical protein [Sphingomonas ursincola]MBA4779210.1 hypothetical protein [Blastomonas sp.]OHC91780.1 MAG: hypothetical protein A2792_06925 [Sphingomonadales bacterium RIFCSPHIGHO2_01_FULL_65_20]MBA1375993.1 hypothetical protein [Sphingomonas ursincola]MBY0618669.1 hypothetical protein [Sphingomonas ursincola]MCH2237022.1 hypothetical protein [Blastomonas sp.]